MLRTLAAILVTSIALVSVPDLLTAHHYIWAVLLAGVGFCTLAYLVAPHSAPGIIGRGFASFVAMIMLAGAIDSFFDDDCGGGT